MDELLNRYRIFPRIFLVCFTLATGVSIQWYLSFPIEYRVVCNEVLLLGLVDRNVELVEATSVSCRPTEVIGRPGGYTALISTLVGACGLVFSFYASSGNPPRREVK